MPSIPCRLQRLLVSHKLFTITSLVGDSLVMFFLCQLQSLEIDQPMVHQIGEGEVVEQEEGEVVEDEVGQEWEPQEGVEEAPWQMAYSTEITNWRTGGLMARLSEEIREMRRREGEEGVMASEAEGQGQAGVLGGMVHLRCVKLASNIWRNLWKKSPLRLPLLCPLKRVYSFCWRRKQWVMI